MTASFGMMRPPVGFGPGSQPDPAEDGLSYPAMPSGMRTYEAHLPTLADPARAAAGRAALDRLHAALAGWEPGRETRIPLDGLDAAAFDLIAETLGEGEVAAVVERPGGRLEIQESVLAGVWRLRARDAAPPPSGAAPPHEALLVGAFPRAALGRAFAGTAAPDLGGSGGGAADGGLMNGPAILTELVERGAAWRRGDPAHVVNFTLLPNTPEDLAYVEARLGRGAVTILSRGYGNCRVTATATPNIWWVRYHNSVDTLILNTAEIVDVPAVVCAAPEDIADSAERLREILAAIGPGAAA